MSDTNPIQIHATGEAIGFIAAPGDKGKPITVIGTNSIRAGFDATCLQQALNARSAPGVTDLVLNPDAHAGYGAPVGCVLTSPTHVYPGPVGVDIKCSISFLQFDLPADQVADKAADRALDQKTVDDEFVANDILTNCRQYPKDEAPAAYKDFDAVLDSVKLAGLASEVARLKARFVIKDADSSLRGAA